MKSSPTQEAKDWLAEVAINEAALLVFVLVAWLMVRKGKP